MKLRRSPQTLLVLFEFMKTPTEWKYGYDLSRGTYLKSGTLYPILMRLADRGLLETQWETAENGLPPRHMYRLTSEGHNYAWHALLERSKVGPIRPAFSAIPAFQEGSSR